jgi:hypothetical protein
VVSGCQTEVLNLTITASTSNTTTASACDSYTWAVNNQTYTTSGSYSVVSGCHTEVLNLTITASTSNTTTASACDSYTWAINNQTYTASGSYLVVSGCHTEVLNLTITASTAHTTIVTACRSYTWSSNGVTYTTSGTYVNTVGCHTETLNLTINLCYTTLNVKAILEGYYRANSGNMIATLQNLGLSNDATATDSISVNLWSASNLGNANPSYTAKGVIHTDGTASIEFPESTLGNNYYIAIKHRNSIETWSASPVTIQVVTNYDFTTGLDKAYGNGINPAMKSIGNGKYAIYSGDVNQDGTVDGLDMNEVDNNTSNGSYGYDSSDVNGDGATDGLDMNIVDNNTQSALYFARP